jgi:hypothetical protein
VPAGQTGVSAVRNYLFGILEIGFWILFGIWNLGFMLLFILG